MPRNVPALRSAAAGDDSRVTRQSVDRAALPSASDRVQYLYGLDRQAHVDELSARAASVCDDQQGDDGSRWYGELLPYMSAFLQSSNEPLDLVSHESRVYRVYRRVKSLKQAGVLSIEQQPDLCHHGGSAAAAGSSSCQQSNQPDEQLAVVDVLNLLQDDMCVVERMAVLDEMAAARRTRQFTDMFFYVLELLDTVEVSDGRGALAVQLFGADISKLKRLYAILEVDNTNKPPGYGVRAHTLRQLLSAAPDKWSSIASHSREAQRQVQAKYAQVVSESMNRHVRDFIASYSHETNPAALREQADHLLRDGLRGMTETQARERRAAFIHQLDAYIDLSLSA